MERVSFVKHKNRDILVVDISGIREVNESIAILQNGTRLVKTQASGSVLLLTNVSGTHYDTSGADAIKTYSKENTPFIKASAVVGVSGIKRLIFNTIIKITGRKIMPFDDVEAAKDWLAGQE